MQIDVMNILANNIKNIELLKKLLDILNSYSKEDIDSIMNILKDCNYNENIFKIIVNKDVLEKRTIKEQIELMKILKKCEYNEYVYRIAVDKDVLENRSIDEQIKLMKEIIKEPIVEDIQKNTYIDNINEIETLSTLKEYLKELEKKYGADADIDLYKKDLTYKPNNKKDKK